MDPFVYIPHDLESYPFFFKTTSMVGSWDKIGIELVAKSTLKSTYVWLHLTNSPYVKMEACNKDGKLMNTPLK